MHALEPTVVLARRLVRVLSVTAAALTLCGSVLSLISDRPPHWPLTVAASAVQILAMALLMAPHRAIGDQRTLVIAIVGLLAAGTAFGGVRGMTGAVPLLLAAVAAGIIAVVACVCWAQRQDERPPIRLS